MVGPEPRSMARARTIQSLATDSAKVGFRMKKLRKQSLPVKRIQPLRRRMPSPTGSSAKLDPVEPALNLSTSGSVPIRKRVTEDLDNDGPKQHISMYHSRT